jgi:L-malate glycosyltransferase
MAEPTASPRHLFHVFSSFAVGGQQTRFVTLANALQRKYRHAVLAMDSDYAAAQGLSEQVDFSIVQMPVVKGMGISAANLRHARRLLRRLRPDLLVTYNWGAIEWSLANWPLRFARHVHIEDGFGPDEAPERQNWRRVAVRRLLLSRCAQVVVPSAVLHDLAIERWRLPRDVVIHLPNGVDCDRFAAPPDHALLAAHGLDSGGLVIGTVAPLRPEKNLKRLIRAFAALPAELGVRLVIVGGGPEREALEAESARLAVARRVVLTGALPNPEKLLGRFDVFALASDTEQMPNSVLEAMSAGLPIVATDVGDLKRMIAPENRDFIVPREREAELSAALLRLLGDRQQRTRIGQSNRDHVRSHYQLRVMVARYDALFSACIGA